MSIESVESHIELPELMVTPEAIDSGISCEDLVVMDRLFPRSEPCMPTIDYLQRLGCPGDLIPLVQQLDTPQKIQEYVDSHLVYDHSDDTRGLVGVFRDGKAHCFEGALFIDTLLEVHKRGPKVVLLQAGGGKRNIYGEDHNIVVYRYKDRLGSVAMSSWPTLKDRPPVFHSLRDLVAIGYWNAYTSEVPGYEKVHNLIGFTDPIDLVKKFGTNWMFRDGPHAEARIF